MVILTNVSASLLMRALSLPALPVAGAMVTVVHMPFFRIHSRQPASRHRDSLFLRYTPLDRHHAIRVERY